MLLVWTDYRCCWPWCSKGQQQPGADWNEGAARDKVVKICSIFWQHRIGKINQIRREGKSGCVYALLKMWSLHLGQTPSDNPHWFAFMTVIYHQRVYRLYHRHQKQQKQHKTWQCQMMGQTHRHHPPQRSTYQCFRKPEYLFWFCSLVWLCQL